MARARRVVTAFRRLRLEADRAASGLRESARRRRYADREFAPIFVVGAIGSGTSLLAASLSQRLAVAGVALESARDVNRGSCLWIDRVQNFASLRAYCDALDPQPGWNGEQAREDLQDLYRAKAESGSSALIIDKGPNTNLVRASFLAGLFPDRPFVLIFRDPVANVEGFRRKWPTFRDDSLDASVAFWRHVHERFLEQAAAFPERVMVVEYEALVANYDACLQRLSQALGVPLSDRPRPLDARAEGQGRGLRGVEAGRIRIVRDANESAYATLDRTEIDRIREALSEPYERLRGLARDSGFGFAPPPA